MIPRTFLYDEYIGRPKFTEQKKPFEYIVPPPTSGVGTKMFEFCNLCSTATVLLGPQTGI